MRTLPRPASAQPGDPPSIGLRRGLIRRPRAGPNLQVRDPFCRRGQLLRRLASRQCFGRCSRLSYQHLHFLGAFVGVHFCPVHKSCRQANDGDGGNRRPGRIVPAQDARYSADDAQEAKSEPGNHPSAANLANRAPNRPQSDASPRRSPTDRLGRALTTCCTRSGCCQSPRCERRPPGSTADHTKRDYQCSFRTPNPRTARK